MTRIFSTVGLPKKLKLIKRKNLKLILKTLIVLLFLGALQKIYTFKTAKVLEGISYSQVIKDREHQILRISLSGDEKYRIWTPIESLPKTYIQATLLMEDQYFFYHPGVNPVALVKSLLSAMSNTQNPAGASTITMQLARLRYGLKTKSVSGKLQQIILALDLEIRHSKKEILEAYFNLIPFGGPIEGVQAASQILLGKDSKNLSTSESLLLTTIPQNPNQRSLDASTETFNPEIKIAFARLKFKWLKHNPKDEVLLKDVDLRSIKRGLKQLPFYAPHFTQWVSSQSEVPNVITTLNLNLQKKIELLLAQYLKSKKSIGVNNATVLVSDSKSGEILAYLGSGGFFNTEILGQNDGNLSRRSPGSSLKPFVYALAMQQGLIHPKTLLKDLPTQYAIYEPENYDRNYLGPIAATQALILSRNIPAVDLNYKLNEPNFYDFLKTSNIYFPKSEEYYGLSLVLGGTELSPWQISELYNMLARHGQWSPLKWHNQQQAKSKKVLEAEAAFMVLDMLTQASRPNEALSSKWMLSKTPIAWKTGTSHGFRDAWTSGLAGPFTVVVWFGNFDNSPNHAFIGKDLAAPFFFSVVDLLKSFDFKPHNPQLIHEAFKDPEWLYTENLQLKQTKVCSVSGHLPGPHCEHLESIWYQPGVSPISKCDVHRPVIIDRASKMRACTSELKNTLLEVFEFWPNDIRKLYQAAGIHRREPPAFMPKCDPSDNNGSSGQNPKIISPSDHVVYLKSQSLNSQLNSISLNALMDGDSAYMHWFIDKKFIAKTKHDQTFTFEPPLGEHKITVVDEHGRTDTQHISVQTVQ